MNNYFDKQYELRFFEMNKYGVSSPTTLLTLLEETASEHCISINASLYDLAKIDIGWILISGYMQVERYPIYKEKITIRTWLSSYTDIRGFRENIIYDSNSNVIARAKGQWIFFDIKRRKPIPIFDDIKNKWSFCECESIEHDITKKIEPINLATYIHNFSIKHFDTDMNKHANNIKYLQWIIESIPVNIEENYYMYAIDGRFIGEAKYGDNIIALTNNGINTESYIHTIKLQSNNKVCATALTYWKRK